jgi:hypothetical protein
MGSKWRLDLPLGEILDEEELTNPGALPVFVSEDQPTANRCATCGTDLDQKKSDFDRGIDHTLRVVREKLGERMRSDEADAVVRWIRHDIDL